MRCSNQRAASQIVSSSRTSGGGLHHEICGGHFHPILNDCRVVWQPTILPSEIAGPTYSAPVALLLNSQHLSGLETLHLCTSYWGHAPHVRLLTGNGEANIQNWLDHIKAVQGTRTLSFAVAPRDERKAACGLPRHSCMQPVLLSGALRCRAHNGVGCFWVVLVRSRHRDYCGTHAA